MDPTLWTDFSGWRHIMIGSAEGFAGIVEWQPDDHYLVVLAPILDLPEEQDQLHHLYRVILELNYHGTLSAHFSIFDNTLYLGITRPIRGLDEEEVDEAIRTVMVLADSYDDRLKELVNLIPPSLPDLPDISLRRKDAQIIGLTLAACDPHGQSIFRHLMEKWEGLGYIVEAGTTGVALSFMLVDQPYALAALHPGFAERRQEVILSWGGLQKRPEFPNAAIERFQTEVLDLIDVKTTANTGHIEVTETFDENKAATLIEVMDRFVQSVRSYHWDIEEPQPEMTKTRLDIRADPATHKCIQQTLLDCDENSQSIFRELILGWHRSGGLVECNAPGRIYFKLETGEHHYGDYGPMSHCINLAVLASPSLGNTSRIELAWNLSQGAFAYLAYVVDEVQEYERVVEKLPGFIDQDLQKYIILSESFKAEHLEILLNSLVGLKDAAMD
jgi:hypothetical protein